MVGTVVNTNPAQSSCLAVDLAPCSPACTSVQACIQGVCQPVIAPPEAGGLPEGTGLFARLVSGPNGQLALVYHDRSNGQLRLATQAADGKFLPTIIDGKDAGSDVGQFASAAY